MKIDACHTVQGYGNDGAGIASINLVLGLLWEYPEQTQSGKTYVRQHQQCHVK